MLQDRDGWHDMVMNAELARADDDDDDDRDKSSRQENSKSQKTSKFCLEGAEYLQ